MSTATSGEADQTYDLCVSFTRNGLTRRVPWVFVFYRPGAKLGTRMRAKDASSENIDLNATHATNHTFRFLAREQAYVDNYSCHGRVVLRKGMSKAERDDAQVKMQATELSAIVDGKRDCQKWCTECMTALGFSEEEVKFWESCLGKNIYDIEVAVTGLEGKWGLKFKRSSAFKEIYVAMADAEDQAEKKALETCG